MVPAHLPSSIVPCAPDHLVYLCRRMREEEREQWTVMSGATQYAPDKAAQGFINLAMGAPAGYSLTALCPAGLPVMSGGYAMVLPGVWESWMLATDEGWARHWRAITKASRWLAERIFEAGAHRLQIQCLTSRRKALTWFDKALGFQPEGVQRGYGIGGQDVALYSRLRSD